MDSDIIQTQNDSAVLLYRANYTEPWHTIPYTQEGTWKTGRFTVSNLQTGQYTIAVIDKTMLSLNETRLVCSIFPNPAKEQVTLQWENTSDGEILVFNQQLQLVKTIPFHNTDQVIFSIEDLKPGIYFVNYNTFVNKLIIE